MADNSCITEQRRYENDGEPHWTAVKTILKYLRNTKDIFLVYGGNPEPELRVDWRSRLEELQAKYYYNEAEYIAASEAAVEAVWIRKFISGFGIVPTIRGEHAALDFANEPRVQRGAIHYHRRYHYVHECIELGEINLRKVNTDDNLADPFTKALSKGKLTQHARSMGLRLASSFM
ncbi:hypothetical protein Tco_0896724 [Tanacetum coccineum]